MKKIFTLILCLLLLMCNSISAFALDKSIAENPVYVNLHISTEQLDFDVMKKSDLSKFFSNNKRLDENVKDQIIKGNNHLTLEINNCNNKPKQKLLSGQGSIKFGSLDTTFSFVNTPFNLLKSEDGDIFSYGTIEVSLPKKDTTMLIDVVEMNNFKKIIATTSCGTLENGIGVLFWGETFDEYDTFYDLQIKALNKSKSIKLEKENTIKAGRNYDYVTKAKSSTVSGGSGGSGETVIIVVGKRDFRDGNATNGYEMIRVFSRTNNAKTYIDNATSAYAVEADVDFTCTTENMLDISDVSPKSTSPSMPKVFNFLSQLYPTTGSAIAAIDLVGYNQAGSVNHTINSTGEFSFDNHANIKIDTSIMSSSSVNLPSGTSYTYAQNDTTHGVCGEIQYQKYMSLSSGSVTSKGRIKYRFYYSTHRYTSAYTNYASTTHTIYGN